MKCPGQDSRYWTGEVVVNVPCPECGSSVEIFKDESMGRCRRCGHKFPNPGADLGCARWCSLAKECLGFVPVGQGPRDATGAFAARLIQWAERHFAGDPARLVHVLKTFHHATELLRKEGGNPRVGTSAAILLAARASRPGGEPQTAWEVQPVLEEIGFDKSSLEEVCRIVAGTAEGEGRDSVEFRVAHDAEALSRLLEQPFPGGPDEWEGVVRGSLRTEAARGKALARSCS